MAPAFSSPRQALAFVLVLLGIVCLPEICSRPGFFRRADAYAAMPSGAGDFAFLRQEIFQEKADLDIVFFGTSSLVQAIDTPYVQKALSTALGRPARVITVGSNLEGEDRSYLLLRDLLGHRRVRMLVFAPVGEVSWRREADFASHYDAPHPWLYRLFQIGPDTEALRGLPFRQQAALYAAAVLGVPRHLLSLVRSETTEIPASAADLGCIRRRAAFEWDYQSFSVFTPTPPCLPASAMILDSWKDVTYSQRPLGPYTSHFVHKMGQLLRDHRVHLVILDLPSLWPGLPTDTLQEVTCWPQAFGMPAELVGVPTARLFAGMTNAEVKKLWSDYLHLNANGMEYFTQTITPALVKVYDKDVPD